MDETILFPSPNWFHSSVLAVSNDNWLVYGGPSKSLCVLEPLPHDAKRVISGSQGYRAHVAKNAHFEKITCVDICRDWPAKRATLTGSSDGTVKQWSIEKIHQSVRIKSTHSHDIHHNEKEEVVGVGYCDNDYAVTVGCFGHIVKWDLKSNVMKSYKHLLKNFKPTCMACSPHLNLQVAIGTKQGVVFVLDLNGAPRTVYKVRGQDDEILKVSWCPQFEVTMRKALMVSQRKSTATMRMEQIRKAPETPEFLKELDERVAQSASVEYFMKENSNADDTKDTEPSVSHPKTIAGFEKDTESSISQTDIDNEKETETERSIPYSETNADNKKETELLVSHSETSADNEKNTEPSVSRLKPQDPNESGIAKTLPEDSFDDTVVVPEDDMFDIYKDHEADEFGHKKYQPEDILVKIANDEQEGDYLTECQKLKEEILKRKNEPEPSIEVLVEAMDNTHVNEKEKSNLYEAEDKDSNADIDTENALTGVNNERTGNENEASSDGNEAVEDETIPEVISDGVSSAHIQRHLLATVGKHGSVRIWSKSGKLVSSCLVVGSAGTQTQNQKQKSRSGIAWTTLLWYTPDMLLIADAKSNLLQCNPLKIDCKNKLEYSVIHSLHKRGLFCIASNAPRVQLPNQSGDWFVWTSAQDRFLIKYSMTTKEVISSYNTCGGFVYWVEPCPYDANKLAISVGDGAVRVIETETLDDDESKLTLKKVSMFWNNVQGKVLVVAWHPTQEFKLAFSTGESRIGILDTSKIEKPAKVFPPALNGGVYSLCWGEGSDLYACGGGEMVVYNTDKVDEAPTPVAIEHEGQKLSMSAVRWGRGVILAGNDAGLVAVLQPTAPYRVITALYVFSKMIHTLEWHPQETSKSSEESPFKNLLAVCSAEKAGKIVILEYISKEDGDMQLLVWKTLSGHKGVVAQVTWNPHVEAQLLSTSQDGTVRIWDASTGVCLSLFGAHLGAALGGTWSASPANCSVAITGGVDCCLRLWDFTDFPVEEYKEVKHEVSAKKEKKRRGKKEKEDTPNEEDETDETENTKATLLDARIKSSKKFLLPTSYKQMNSCSASAPRRMLKKYLESSGDNPDLNIPDASDERGLDFLKLFGTTNEVNELLNDELERHEDTGCLEQWMMLNIFRGQIDAMIQYASKKNLLDPYLLSITPCVSLKYWKDATQLYLAQIDRLVAKGEDSKLTDCKMYGGPVYRKAATLLSVHDVIGAIRVLSEANLFKEAYVLCRTRYVDSIAMEVLLKWAYNWISMANYNMAAVCFIALGELSYAAKVLGKAMSEDSLSLAADIAKILGQATYVDHIVKKREEIITNIEIQSNEKDELEELPSRIELVINEALKEKGHDGSGDTEKVLAELPSKLEKLMAVCESSLIKEGSSNTEIDNKDANSNSNKHTNEKEVNSNSEINDIDESAKKDNPEDANSNKEHAVANVFDDNAMTGITSDSVTKEYL